MPKSYSEEEKDIIIKSLKKEARYLLEIYGVKRTTVDDIVKRVNIPKGTFYLFYKSKEILLFEVILEEHENMHKILIESIDKIKDNISVENLTETIFQLYKKSEDSLIIKMIGRGDIEILFRKLPKKNLEEHFEYDNDMIKEIINIIPKIKSSYSEIFSEAFRNLFITMIYEREKQNKYFDVSLKLLIKGLVIQLME